MANSGYVQILHELIRSDLVLDAPIAYRWVLITLLDRVVFTETEVDDHGNKIILFPGQFLTTYRQLATLANVDKNDVERAVKYFREIVRQEVRHRKTIFTILWGIKTQTCETINETKVRQERDIKQEQKNKREQQQGSVDVVVFSSLERFTDEEIPRKLKISISKKHSEKVVDDAVEYLKSNSFVPEHSWSKALNAALKYGWKKGDKIVPISDPPEFEPPDDMKELSKNRKYANKKETTRK